MVLRFMMMSKGYHQPDLRVLSLDMHYPLQLLRLLSNSRDEKRAFPAFFEKLSLSKGIRYRKRGR